MKIITDEITRKMLKDCKNQICIELNGDDIIALIQKSMVSESYPALADIVIVHKRQK